jgi:hypothetical protein
MTISTFCQFIVVFLTAVIAIARPLAANGLSVHPKNPRYFTDGSGKAIYLGGHQIFVDLQDNSFNKEFIRYKERTLDWDRYLGFLKAHDSNYLRNWVIWSTGSGAMAPINQAIAFPMPYKRVKGYGKAKDGKDKFDLRQFDEVFFQRMLKRCEDLQKCGIYVSIMLFEVYGFLNGEACGNPKQTLWDGNIFNKQNNINGIHVDYDGNGNGIEFFYTQDKRVLQLQKEYVKKVIDTVNHLDNVFYEIANELEAPEWQYKITELIKDYEKTKLKKHLVLMSAGGRTSMGSWRQMGKDKVTNSPADCFAVAASWQSGRYRRKDPPVNNNGKPGIVDMDHVAPGSHDVEFIWSAFTRGYHFNLYDKPFESPEAEGPEWECMRNNIKKTVEYARKLDLANVSPMENLASTGFCLAKRGYQYVVYQPEDTIFTVTGLRGDTVYYYEWYNTKQSEVVSNGHLRPSGQKETFAPPNKGLVLYLTSLPAAGNADVCCTVGKR